jgi:hypothetical protein
MTKGPLTTAAPVDFSHSPPGPVSETWWPDHYTMDFVYKIIKRMFDHIENFKNYMYNYCITSKHYIYSY